jgi:SAM-dependent methyltransferase
MVFFRINRSSRLCCIADKQLYLSSNIDQRNMANPVFLFYSIPALTSGLHGFQMPIVNSAEAGNGPSRCAVCGCDRLEYGKYATGDRIYCIECFHGRRRNVQNYSYQTSNMCARGTSPERIADQFDFMRPHIQSGAAVFEIGCATGELGAFILSSLPISRYEAVELSPAAEMARAHLGTVHRVPLPSVLARGLVKPASFDLIIMSHVLEHIDDVVAEIRAVRTILKPSGVLFIEVPNGSGNPALPFDDNLTHIHFFSPNSLLRLLATHGMLAVSIATGGRLDARYIDSLRVIASPFAVPDATARPLSEHPLIQGQTEIAIWGAGTLATELLENFFDAGRIAFFIDSDPAKQGLSCLGRPIYSPEVLLNRLPAVLLINSIEFADEIEAALRQVSPGFPGRVIRIEQLLSAC